jgi:hypothetical protein
MGIVVPKIHYAEFSAALGQPAITMMNDNAAIPDFAARVTALPREVLLDSISMPAPSIFTTQRYTYRSKR